MGHLVVMTICNTRLVESSHQVVHLLAATDEGSEGKLVVRSGILDLLDLIGVRPI